ncbi:unnamed protein product [Cuscuta campestris]|uniref:Reverse transcriptase Ty1/copia-type domain-containing protein n=1 Tax=Cuscuta campestris TaxID=132261 RepID=A0A484LZI8_9ASTE|nr:unnamed protein product [Cuscuta campestris]
MMKVPYASAMCSIMYAMICTRPYVSFALSVTSKYQASPGEAHWTAVKIILKYLWNTNDAFLDTTADSTREAEYMAAVEAAKEGVWIKKFISELGVVPSINDPISLFCDNTRAIAQQRNHNLSKRPSTLYDVITSYEKS